MDVIDKGSAWSTSLCYFKQLSHTVNITWKKNLHWTNDISIAWGELN